MRHRLEIGVLVHGPEPQKGGFHDQSSGKKAEAHYVFWRAFIIMSRIHNDVIAVGISMSR